MLDLSGKFEAVSPTNCELGRYYHRKDTVYPYLRDNIFPNVQKFNKSLRIIEISNPTGTTEQDMNMAVAIHLGETQKMDYAYKDYDHLKWKFYGAFQVLRKLPKFQNRSDSESGSDEKSAGRETVRRGGRGKNFVVAAKIKEDRESRKRAREEEKDKT